MLGGAEGSWGIRVRRPVGNSIKERCPLLVMSDLARTIEIAWEEAGTTSDMSDNGCMKR